MTFAIDKSLHWTDHYVEYGFAVVRGAVGADFIEPALAEIRAALHNALPLNEWTIENTPMRSPVPMATYTHLPTIYDQPGIRDIIDTMFGSPDEWNRARQFHVFISPWQPAAQPPSLPPAGHLDFVQCPIPTLGSGFVFQVALAQTEAFSGNITIYPGSHRTIQQALVANPDLFFGRDKILNELLTVEPYEFIAAPGDVLLMHHLVGHQGNPNHSSGHAPRVALQCQANRSPWLDEIDPAAPNLSPWQRSLAFTGGKYRPRRNEEEWVREFAKTRTTKPKPFVYAGAGS